MQARKGFGLIEIVIAASIISTAIVSLSYVFVLSHRLSIRSSDKIRANFLAEQALESWRFGRDVSWAAFIAPITPGINYSAPIDSTFTKTTRVEEVKRDNTSQNIMASDCAGCAIDPDTRKIIATISWANGSTSVETYLSNIFNN